MPSVQQGIQNALRDGVSPDEIVSYLKDHPEVGKGVQAALADDVPAAEIVKYLANPVASKQAESMGTAEKLAIQGMQGVTGGFFDELAGAIGAIPISMQQGIPLGEAYRQGRDIVRAKTEQARKDMPIAGTAANIGGSLLSAPIMGPIGLGSKIVSGASLPARVLGSAITGGQYGALSALGETPDITNASRVASDVGKGALGGAALSGATTAVAPVLGAATRQITSRASPDLARQMAQEKVAEALSRGIQTTGSPAAARPPLTQIDRASAMMSELGPEARIADVSQPTRSLLDVLATLPGTTKQQVEQAIRQRQAGAAGRLMAGAEAGLGKQASAVDSTVEGIIAAQRAASKPYYNILDRVKIRVTPELETLLQRTQAAHSKAEGFALMETGQRPDLSQLKVGDMVPFQLLDTVKKSLDDLTSAARRAGEGNAQRVAANTASDLVSYLKKAAPKIGGKSAYEQALKGFAGPAKVLDAVDVGKDAMRMNFYDLRDAVRQMGPSELDGFRLGAAQAVRDKVGKESGRTELLKFWKEPATADRLKLIFGNDFQAMSRALRQESRLKEFESIGRGSQTAGRVAAMEDLATPALQNAADVATALKTGAIGGLIDKGLIGLRRAQTPEPVRNEAARILLSRDQQELLGLTDMLRKIDAARRASAARTGVVGGQAGGYFMGG